MFLAFHYPYFGGTTIDAYEIRCVECGANDWKEQSIETCNPGDKWTCARCGKVVEITWGLVEPDHLSNWINSEYCPHRLCRIKYAQLQKERGWKQ